MKPPVARFNHPVRTHVPSLARVEIIAIGVPSERHIPGTATGMDGREHTTVVPPPLLVPPPPQLQPVFP